MKRRVFLEMVGRAGGAGAVYQAMSGMGLLATPRNEPPKLNRSARPRVEDSVVDCARAAFMRSLAGVD